MILDSRFILKVTIDGKLFFKFSQVFCSSTPNDLISPAGEPNSLLLTEGQLSMQNQGKYNSDNQLFQVFCSQGKEAVNKIYHDFYALIEFMVVKNSGIAQDAEDVFQEGLMALLNYCGNANFKLNAPFKNFFYTVCRNIWLKKLRKKRRLEITFVDVWESVDLKGVLKTEEAAGLTAEQLVLLWKYMNRLPEHEQKTLRLFYLEGKSLKEIAEIMGFSDEASARVQKFRYVRHLRKLIQEDPDYE